MYIYYTYSVCTLFPTHMRRPLTASFASPPSLKKINDNYYYTCTMPK